MTHHVTSRCQGLFPPASKVKGKSPGNEVAFQLGGVAGCSEFILHVRFQVRTWESYRVEHIIVASVIRFAKNNHSMRVNKDLSNPDVNYNKRWSIVNRVCG